MTEGSTTKRPRGWPQMMILLFLIMRCTPTIRELIEATPLLLSSPSATNLSVLAPTQWAGAKRFCALALLRHRGLADQCPLLKQERTLRGSRLRAAFDPSDIRRPVLLCHTNRLSVAAQHGRVLSSARGGFRFPFFRPTTSLPGRNGSGFAI